MKKLSNFIQKNSFISSFLGSASVVAILRLADFLFLKSGLRIIDLVFLFLILFGVIFLIIIHRKVRSIPTSRDEGQLRTDFDNHREGYKKFVQETDKKIRDLRQDLSQIYDKAKKYEQIDIKEEYIFILETAGAQADKIIDIGVMKVLYMQKFRFSTGQEANLSFNMNINWLEKNNYILHFPTDMEGIEYHIEITERGFEYLRLAKKKIEEESKEEDTP